MSNEIFVAGTLTIDDKGYEFYFNNDIDEGFDHEGYSSLAYNIISDLNSVLSRYQNLEIFRDAWCTRCETVKKCSKAYYQNEFTCNTCGSEIYSKLFMETEEDNG